MAGKKQDVITLKVDRSLAEALEGIANRTDFDLKARALG